MSTETRLERLKIVASQLATPGLTLERRKALEKERDALLADDEVRVAWEASAPPEIDFSAIEPAAGYETLSEFVEEVAALALLPEHEYDRQRKADARRLGVRVTTLDKAVQLARPRDAGSGGGQGRPIELPEIELWPDPVDGAELIGDLVTQIRRFVVLSDHAATAVALWVIFAYAHDAAFHSPRLAILSPLPRCGKSTLLRAIGMLTVRKVAASSVTAPAIFRLIEAASGVVLLIDELDNLDPEKASELVAIINAGHCRADAHVIRVVPVDGDLQVRRFSCWAAAALSAIKKLPPTWIDRSVVVRMARRGRGERVERLRDDRDQGFAALARRAARWASDHLEQLRSSDPEVPAPLNDRQADNWRMLLQIADLAGNEWGERARQAALALSGADWDDRQVAGELLLSDLRAYFDATNEDRAPSLILTAYLNHLEGRPWAEFSRGGPMSQNQLAILLKPFGIAPGTIRTKDNQTPKGYMRRAFEAAWDRYCAQEEGSPAATTTQSAENLASGGMSAATKIEDVAAVRKPKAKVTATCGVVAAESRGKGAHTTNSAPAAGINAAGVSFMITNAQRAELRARGYTDDKIAHLLPAEAHRILAEPAEPTPAPPPPAAPEVSADARRFLLLDPDRNPLHWKVLCARGFSVEQLERMSLAEADRILRPSASAAAPEPIPSTEPAPAANGAPPPQPELPLGERVREARRQRDLTQTQLAKLAECPQPTVSQLELGRHVSAAVEARILAALEINPPASAGTTEE